MIDPVHNWPRFNTSWRTIFSHGPGMRCAFLYKLAVLNWLSSSREMTVVFRSKQISASCSDTCSTESFSLCAHSNSLLPFAPAIHINLLGARDLLHIRIFSNGKSLWFFNIEAIIDSPTKGKYSPTNPAHLTTVSVLNVHKSVEDSCC